MTLNRKLTNLLVTGGAGFIGSNFIRFLFEKADFAGTVVNLDKLTYAGNPGNLADVQSDFPDRYTLIQGDICDAALVSSIFEEHEIDTVVHFAAESHVDRSIEGPEAFIQTNVVGTYTLLQAARTCWAENLYEGNVFHHVSTDEVFGSLGEEGAFDETTAYDPRSPYSASKASSDHLVKAYYHTYGLPVTMTNCSNNYGPYQFPEKLIPLIIENILEGKPLPVYGDGRNIRDWLYVEDHTIAVWTVMNHGQIGRTYTVGGENEWENIRLVHSLCEIVAEKTGKEPSDYRKLIRYVKDRPGHDRRYAIDCSRIKAELGWRQSVDFTEGLRRTVQWYLDNRDWVANIKTGEYHKWAELNYSSR